MFEINCFFMKTNKLYLFLVVFFCFTAAASAQYGGMDRRIGAGQYQSIPKKKVKKDFTELTLDHLKKELSIDDFQSAAIKSILDKYKGEVNAINEDKALSHNERKGKSIIIVEKIDTEIFPLLSEEQSEKFKALIAKRKY